MDQDLESLSRSIDAADLGRRLRRARVVAGLTQAQVAGDDVSAAYVSRIEDGQRRPEFQLLRRMVSRIGTTLEMLMTEEDLAAAQQVELQVAIDHAELSLASGDAGAALRQVEVLDDGLRGGGLGHLRRRVAQVRAGALEALGNLNDAILLLEDLTAEPSPDARWLTDLIALSRCYRETGDLDRSIAVGERASSVIERLGLDGYTEAIQLTVTVAGAHMIRGDLGVATRMCRRAVATAEATDSPVARASAYWNASLIESRNGNHAAALLLARKALASFELHEDARNVARLRTQVAKMQLMVDPPDPAGAIKTLERAELELAWTSSSTIDRASSYLTRARAHVLLMDYEEASRSTAEALSLLPETAAFSRAAAFALEGRIAMATHNLAVATQRLRLAVQVLSSVGADREAAQLWFELGTLLTNAGETELALDAFRRAGASTGLTAAPLINQAPV